MQRRNEADKIRADIERLKARFDQKLITANDYAKLSARLLSRLDRIASARKRYALT
jgi:hypothetical protein